MPPNAWIGSVPNAGQTEILMQMHFREFKLVSVMLLRLNGPEKRPNTEELQDIAENNSKWHTATSQNAKKVTNTEVSYQFVLTSTENICLINNSKFHFCVRHPLNTAMEGKQKAGETKSMARSLVLIFNIRSRE